MFVYIWVVVVVVVFFWGGAGFALVLVVAGCFFVLVIYSFIRVEVLFLCVFLGVGCFLFWVLLLFGLLCYLLELGAFVVDVCFVVGWCLGVCVCLLHIYICVF